MLIAPLMPGINDAPQQIEPLLELAQQAGATSIGGMALHLRGEVREVFMDWLRAQRPDLVARYEELYRRGAYAPREERERCRGWCAADALAARDAAMRARAGHDEPSATAPRRPSRARRACSEQGACSTRAEPALVELLVAALRTSSVAICSEPSSARRCAPARARAGEHRARPQRQRRDIDLAAVALDRA